jgi:hypothetical protein
MLEIGCYLNHIFLVRSIYHQRPGEAPIDFVFIGPAVAPGYFTRKPVTVEGGGGVWGVGLQ